jgi:hypothetical protein
LSPGLVAGQSLLTPACGMGTMKEAEATKALVLLSQLSEKCAEVGLSRKA